MARQLRPYLPGAVFHITARTHSGQAWFDPATRDFICKCLSTVQRRLDTMVLAFVVMPNHLHIVARQGDEPLGRFMHPLLTRIAMTVRKKHDLVGHVFGRRYWSHPCITEDYLATCIAYVHHNPVKAELCAAARDYKWSSADCYAGGHPPFDVIVEPVVTSMATSTTPPPAFFTHQSPTRPLLSMEHIVTAVIREFDLDIDVDVLRRMRGRIAASVRRVCIRRAVDAGYRNCQIARYLCIGESTVSHVAVQVRGRIVVDEECLDQPKMKVGKQTPKK